ncbi:MAG: conditioned medium factor [Ardenticatenia bacterium]|nr:MAG: conditioned medium factor [Ardenticatenia bacterium]
MMRTIRLLLTLFVVAVLFVVAGPVGGSPTAQADAPLFKQVAGPADDIAAGLTALPSPERLGIRSHSAMLPVHLVRDINGTWRWQTAIPLDSTEELTFVLLSPHSDEWTIDVQSPGAAPMRLNDASATESTFGFDGASYPATVYHFDQSAPTGTWAVSVTAPTSTARGATPDGYLIVGSESPYRLYAHLRDYNLHVGREIGLVAYAYDDTSAVDGEAPTPLRTAKQVLYARVQQPDGRELTLAMYDDGRHGDKQPNDGVYGATFTARQAGTYTAQVVLQGVTPEGTAFLRTSQHVFPVIDATASLGKQAVGVPVDDVRMRLTIPVQGLSDGATVQAYAEVWGIGATGKPVPAAWIGGMSEVRNGVTTLTFDTRWLGYANVHPPYTLRNIRLQDRETHIPLATSRTMSLMTFSVPKAALQRVSTITDEMLMGPRPDAGIAPMATGGKLMLVHGYCSGSNPWPTSHFSNYAVFQDYNQNRSHDEFARLIRDYGAQFPSFGIVAHSQGGAASLHLYTYYWSGLDYSSGSRLIQTVGTPYQGTALAGNLALLGEIFGIGCGSNWDLTYDGAALWLSGIPSWARSRVHYWTTSDKEVWWRWDYCNMATDPILDDPEDGVVEKWSGQLAYGVNHGHKEGWCHTSSMRDPAQTSDYSRNSEMNLYGNR